MADFYPVFDSMLDNEGGLVLHTVAGDRGGQTYAGISRKNWPQWPGWQVIDAGQTPTLRDVSDFYLTNFWHALRLGQIEQQAVARTIFDFAVNAGCTTAARLAQITVGVPADGKVGPVTLAAINALDAELFVLRYTLAKLARYEQIVRRDRTQSKFLLGWVARTIKEASV